MISKTLAVIIVGNILYANKYVTYAKKKKTVGDKIHKFVAIMVLVLSLLNDILL